jgi:hypothetical protein
MWQEKILSISFSKSEEFCPQKQEICDKIFQTT